MYRLNLYAYFFFFNDPATTEIYTLSLHDALPIYDDERQQPPLPIRIGLALRGLEREEDAAAHLERVVERLQADRKSTRLNSSHLVISYAVFCLKKKKQPLAYE